MCDLERVGQQTLLDLLQINVRPTVRAPFVRHRRKGFRVQANYGILLKKRQ